MERCTWSDLLVRECACERHLNHDQSFVNELGWVEAGIEWVA